MPRNPFAINIKPMNLYGQKTSSGKRTLGIRDKQILYRRAKGRCEVDCTPIYRQPVSEYLKPLLLFH